MNGRAGASVPFHRATLQNGTRSDLGRVANSYRRSLAAGAELRNGTFPTKAARIKWRTQPLCVDSLRSRRTARRQRSCQRGLTDRLAVGVAFPIPESRSTSAYEHLNGHRPYSDFKWIGDRPRRYLDQRSIYVRAAATTVFVGGDRGCRRGARKTCRRGRDRPALSDRLVGGGGCRAVNGGFGVAAPRGGFWK